MNCRILAETRRHPVWIWGAAAALTVLHHDFWWWDDRTLVLGILPVGLAYHAAFSVAAAVLWALACRWAWPAHLEEWAQGEPSAPPEDQRP
jgi:hypothetical protein